MLTASWRREKKTFGASHAWWLYARRLPGVAQFAQ